MISEAIKRKIAANQIILYRRVSTAKQEKGEFANQLQFVKSKYPEFNIASNAISSITEVRSGRADPEVRMASGLGRTLRLLQRHPDAVLLVSDADRIARRADVFGLIQRQGLGHRVFDASTGMNVNDIVRTGVHNNIEIQTEKLRAARQAGLEAYQASGAQLGSMEIKNHSSEATLMKQRRAKQRCDAIVEVVRQIIHKTRGRIPQYDEICEELDHLEIRTGQGRFFTTLRLSQRKKQHPVQWREAIDSYAAPRRRVRWLVTSTQIELRNRRNRKHAHRIKMGRKDFTSDEGHVAQALSDKAHIWPIWRKEIFCGFRSCGQCRGPPTEAVRYGRDTAGKSVRVLSNIRTRNMSDHSQKIDKYLLGGAFNDKDTGTP